MNFILKNAKLSFLALIISFGFTACDEEDDFNPGGEVTTVNPTPDPDPDPDPDDGSSETNTIIDYAGANGYTTFVAAVEAAGLTETLSGDTEFTVFVPTNDAFQALLDSNENWSALEDIPVETLELVLMNHVQSGSIMSSSLATGYLTSMAEAGPDGENVSLYVSTDGGVMLNGVSTVTSADIEVDNGIIHEVDTVIGLPDVTTFATADPNFSSLAAGLTDEELVAVLQSTDSPAPFTIFAPTDDAFVALLADLGVGSLGEIGSETLVEVLEYHVITDDNVTSDELSDGLTVTTLQGQDLTINVDGEAVTITDTTGASASVLIADIQATNGVIHQIDTVIMPDLSGDGD